ncbi:MULTISPECIES: hypothetical protein [unclassified Streptomyces]|uniref:hypothetical protein n=1 Tax=unclassified Streptomyces TaxID=2593676 RepID=UPI0033CB2B99
MTQNSQDFSEMRDVIRSAAAALTVDANPARVSCRIDSLAREFLRCADQLPSDPIADNGVSDAATLAWIRILATTDLSGIAARQNLASIARDSLANDFNVEIQERVSQVVSGGSRDLFGSIVELVAAVSASSGINLTILALEGLGGAAKPDDPFRWVVRSILASAFRDRYRSHGRRDDLAKCLQYFSEVFESDSDLRVLHGSRYGAALRAQFEQSGELSDFEKATSLLRTICVSGDGAFLATACLELATTLLVGFQHLENTDLLDDAIVELRSLVELDDTENFDENRARNNLGSALYLRFEIGGDGCDLDESIDAYRRAVDSESELDERDRSMYRENLGAVLCVRFSERGDYRDLQESLSTLEMSLGEPSSDPGARAEVMGNYVTALQLDYAHTGDVASLDRAIGVAKETVSIAIESGPKVTAKRNLAHLLCGRYATSGDLVDLDTAIIEYEEVLELVSESGSDMATHLVDLGGSLCDRFNYTGDEADRDKGINFLRQGFSLRSRVSPYWCIDAHALGVALHTRFQVRGAIGDLEEATGLLRDSLDAMPGGHVYRSVHLSSLATCLHTRFETFHEGADIDDAVELLEQAHAIGFRGPVGTTALSNLGGALVDRYRFFHDLDDIERAISFHRMAVEESDDFANNCSYRANLGEALALKARETRSMEDIDLALAVLCETVRVADERHPDFISMILFCGRAYAVRADLAGDDSDRKLAIGEFRRAARLHTGSPRRRWEAAQEWVTLAEQSGNSQSATEAHSERVSLLTLLAWTGLPRGDQERILAESQNVTADGVSWAIGNSDPELALQFAEQGRSVLWAQTLHTRVDLARLLSVRQDLSMALTAVTIKMNSLA